MSKNLSITYQESAEKFLELKKEDPNFQENTDIVIQFAKYLDGFTTLDDKMQLLAMKKSREIDGEVLKEMAKHIPQEKLKEILTTIMAKHKHKKDYGSK